MSLTTCSKKHCWAPSLDYGWCNRHTNERIAELEAKIAKDREAMQKVVENTAVIDHDRMSGSVEVHPKLIEALAKRLEE